MQQQQQYVHRPAKAWVFLTRISARLLRATRLCLPLCLLLLYSLLRVLRAEGDVVAVVDAVAVKAVVDVTCGLLCRCRLRYRRLTQVTTS